MAENTKTDEHIYFWHPTGQQPTVTEYLGEQIPNTREVHLEKIGDHYRGVTLWRYKNPKFDEAERNKYPLNKETKR